MYKALTAKAAAQLDQELMSTGAFSIDQLMELAGLAVAKAIYKQYPPQPGAQVLMLVGPGNNGGDGLVCARHLKAWRGYEPVLYYPKRPNRELYHNLTKQLQDMGVKELSMFSEVKSLLESNDVALIVDSLFGFSFKPPIREPFDELILFLAKNNGNIAPIVSVDIPSGWHVDEGPVTDDINPAMLVSLTAPKPCAKFFDKPGRAHYVGGRFINDAVAEKYGITELMAKYRGDDLVLKL